MKRLQNKRILLGVTGSIAAYKSAELVRRLRDAGAEVQVIMSEGAKAFITPLTMQAVSGNPVRDSLLDSEAEAGMGHIELARWADALVIAPASADCIARLAQGRADDLLSTVCLATEAPCYIAPAMNSVMWQDVSTRRNCQLVEEQGIQILGPSQGLQACGENGPGRMLEVDEIVQALADTFATGVLAGVHVLVTAGPTCEDIDPVRFISNRSSGKMGFAVAEAAVEAGARVTLVSGPVSLLTPERVRRIDVRSAADMLEAVTQPGNQSDIVIAVAAVADFRPVIQQTEKIKKQTQSFTLQLEKTDDILQILSRQSPRAFLVGFAAETANLRDYARSKLENKSLDMIAANQVGLDANGKVIGFDADENSLLVISKDDETELPRASKTKLARQLIELVAKRYHENKHRIKNTG
jgi:phosphopantothenoylcysteine decarboxylase/phosphopantothenate--cysteine ligase